MAGEGADEGVTVVAYDEERLHPEQQRRRRRAQQKRARTGCDRCRTRRRKCDEQKPQCRRCADAGAECQYVTRLSFLDKNAWTLSHDVPDTESDRPGYRTVLFVPNEASAIQPETDISGSIPSNQNAGQDIASMGRTVGANEFQEPLHSGGFDGLGTAASRIMTQTPQKPGAQQLERRPNAVHGTAPDPAASLRDLLVGNHVPSSAEPQSSTTLGTKVTLHPLTKELSLTHNAMELLKYYGHHIAPWLDIADLGQTFSLLVPRLAIRSPIVLDAVLKVSAVASGSSVDSAELSRKSFSYLRAAFLGSGQVPDFVVLQTLANSVLLRAQIFVESVPDTWDHTFALGGLVPRFPSYNFEDASCQRIWLGMIALMSRLELAHSLMHEVAPAVGSEVLREMLASSEATIPTPDGFQKILNASLRCLALLSDVMSLCLPPEDQDTAQSSFPATPHISKADRWKYLLSELLEWHIHRPSELQELAELEGRDASFPTAIFTSGAGVSANITYHVAMFLLLRHRPRTMPSFCENSETQATETYVSPLWHAQRVCGIALGSDPQHTQYWDPCMIAAFAVTARRMTHPAQQTELLACLDRVKVSGWRVDSLVRSLRDEWGPSCPG